MKISLAASERVPYFRNAFDNKYSKITPPWPKARHVTRRAEAERQNSVRGISMARAQMFKRIEQLS